MKRFFTLFLLLSTIYLFSTQILFAQEEPGVFKTSVQYKGDNSNNPDDVSGTELQRTTSQQEKKLIDEIRMLREKNDRSLLNRILDLENQLEKLNPNSVNNSSPVSSPNEIGHTEIFNSGSSYISGIATATEQAGATAGRIWVALFYRTSGSDSLRVYFSDSNGSTWSAYAYGYLGGTDVINFDQVDMEIIENTTGEKYVWIVYGYRNSGGTGRWRTGGLILQTPTFGAGFFALSWPSDDATKRFYRARITSDNARYPSLAYVYMVASFDSLTSANYHNNTQKTLRCTNPYTTTPTFSYKADKFYWNTTPSDGNIRDLHSDIAFFHNGSDSIIVSYSNMRDSTKIFFAKSNISNGPGTSTGAGGGGIGGSSPSDYKQFGRMSSNGNDNGSIICVFRQSTNNIWRISYYRTNNYGNFAGMHQAVLQGSPVNHSYQPDIVGVRNAAKHYFAWTVNGTPDSLRYIGTNAQGIWDQNVYMMNSQSSLSGTQGPKPGFRYVNDDSCFVIYSPFGPYHVWSAYGCEPGTAASVTVTSPNGGETWGIGTSHNITWTSSGVTNVKIELSTNNGSNWSNIIASTPSTGTYSWNVSNTPSAQCLVRISDVSSPSTQDVSDGVFTIELLPGVEDELSGIPNDYVLLQNYPNPFNPTTTIYYGLPQESSVKLIIYDVLGNQILKISEEQQQAGYHKVEFDASSFRSGVYFYRIEAGKFVQTRKMILIK
jgi:hypothetical protein